jgi:acyl carrier protein phosphodiesterase
MNWLAHLFLAEAEPAFQLGSILPDLVDNATLATLPTVFLRGIRHHQQVDVFTDTHPIPRRTARRISPPYRRFGAIIADVFYDHFLANRWDDYSNGQLRNFIDEVYSAFENFRHCLPDLLNARLAQIRSEDWLYSYRETSGIRRALDRVGLRLRHPLPLGDSVADLEIHYRDFQLDFTEFFPSLLIHATAGRHIGSHDPGEIATGEQ